MAMHQVEYAPHEQADSRVRMRRWVPMLVLVVIVAAVGWGERQAMVDQFHETFGPQVDVRVSTEPITAGPLSKRRDASAVWTGSRMIVWGGYASAGDFTMADYADGASYDPATTAWTPIAASPLSGREQHLAVWTGKEMIVWGGVRRSGEGTTSRADGAAYDPATDRWRRIADAPRAGVGVSAGGAPTGVMWGDKLAVVVQQDQSREGSRPVREVLLYDVANDRWSEVPVGERPLQAVVYRDALAVLGGEPNKQMWLNLLRPDGDSAWAFDVSLPPLLTPSTSIGVVATDRGLVVAADVDDRTALVRYTQDPSRPTGEEVLPEVTSRPSGTFAAPLDLFAGFPAIAGALDDRHVVTYSPMGASVIDVTTGAVATLDRGEDYCGSAAALAWTGTRLLAWGGEDCRDMSGPRTMAGGFSYTPTIVP